MRKLFLQKSLFASIDTNLMLFHHHCRLIILMKQISWPMQKKNVPGKPIKTTMAMASHLYPISVVVEQQYSRTCHFLGFHHRLEVSQQTHVFGHVCCQHLNRSECQWAKQWGSGGWDEGDETHHVYDELPQALPLPLAEVLKDVTVVLMKELEAHSQVMVLQDGLVVVHQGQLGVWGEATHVSTQILLQPCVSHVNSSIKSKLPPNSNSFLLVFMRNWLETPGWSTSWMAAANKAAKISRSVKTACRREKAKDTKSRWGWVVGVRKAFNFICDWRAAGDIYIQSWCGEEYMSRLSDICSMEAVVVGHVGMVVVLEGHHVGNKGIHRDPKSLQ